MAEPRGTLRLWTGLLLVLALFAAGALYAAIPRVAEAPDFTVTTTGAEAGADGPQEIRLSALRGRTVVLDLMAVACIPCREVTAEVLKPLAARHAGDGLLILSIDTWADPATGNAFGGETVAALRGLQEREGAHWPHALDTDQVWRKYSAIGLPRVVVVGPDGRIAFDHQGVPALADVERAVASASAGAAATVPILGASLPALAALAGGASVLAPCCVGLVPAYFGLLLGRARDGSHGAAGRSRAAAVLLGAGATFAGFLLVTVALAALVWLAGPWLAPLIPRLPLAVGLLLLAGGAWALLGRGLPGFARLASRIDGRRGFVAFGAGFGLAGFGCTAPVAIPLMVAGVAEGPGPAALLLAAYALAAGAVLVALAVAVAAGADGPLQRALRHSGRVQRSAAALVVLAGAYVAWKAWP